jgi:hypothetical protein
MQQHSPTMASAASPQAAATAPATPVDVATAPIAPRQAVARLSRQAFRDMLVAAERVNRHHLGEKAQQRPT